MLKKYDYINIDTTDVVQLLSKPSDFKITQKAEILNMLYLIFRFLFVFVMVIVMGITITYIMHLLTYIFGIMPDELSFTAAWQSTTDILLSILKAFG